MPTQVTRFQSSDNQLFLTPEEAEQHEAFLDFTVWLETVGPNNITRPALAKLIHEKWFLKRRILEQEIKFVEGENYPPDETPPERSDERRGRGPVDRRGKNKQLASSSLERRSVLWLRRVIDRKGLPERTAEDWSRIGPGNQRKSERRSGERRWYNFQQYEHSDRRTHVDWRILNRRTEDGTLQHQTEVHRRILKQVDRVENDLPGPQNAGKERRTGPAERRVAETIILEADDRRSHQHLDRRVSA